MVNIEIKPWSPDGVNFSERLRKVINNLHTDLTQAFIRGKSPQKTISRFSKRFGTKKEDASRFILTESDISICRKTKVLC